MASPERNLRVAFSPGVSRWWRKQRLAAKYVKMRLEGVIYPDVYCLPYFLADEFGFLLQGERVAEGRYDLILSELKEEEDSQLEYLESLVAARLPVAVIAGPPEVLVRNLTERRLGMVKRILSEAPHLWAYSANVARFCDGLVGRRRAAVIPWPFHYAQVVRLGREGEMARGKAKILLQAPLRFCGATHAFPFILKGVLADVWASLPASARSRISFHTFVYTHEDRLAFARSGFAQGPPINLERKMSYPSFVRFLGGCRAVVNLTAGGILGRITFLAAALGRPGIFSDNSEMNQALYPDSAVSLFDTVRLRELLAEMLFSVAEDRPAPRLLPRTRTAAEIGDFDANAARMLGIVGQRLGGEAAAAAERRTHHELRDHATT